MRSLQAAAREALRRTTRLTVLVDELVDSCGGDESADPPPPTLARIVRLLFYVLALNTAAAFAFRASELRRELKDGRKVRLIYFERFPAIIDGTNDNPYVMSAHDADFVFDTFERSYATSWKCGRCKNRIDEVLLDGLPRPGVSSEEVRSALRAICNGDRETYACKWRFIGCFYFALTVFTTIGFGDFAPQKDSSKILVVVVLLVGGAVASRGCDVCAERLPAGTRARGLRPGDDARRVRPAARVALRLFRRAAALGCPPASTLLAQLADVDDEGPDPRCAWRFDIKTAGRSFLKVGCGEAAFRGAKMGVYHCNCGETLCGETFECQTCGYGGGDGNTLCDSCADGHCAAPAVQEEARMQADISLLEHVLQSGVYKDTGKHDREFQIQSASMRAILTRLTKDPKGFTAFVKNLDVDDEISEGERDADDADDAETDRIADGSSERSSTGKRPREEEAAE
ncbi:hypothetical protein M885DRAFT_612227 [Pelagophyceae sp. CCMP2097]|nr:hypothetical protein M885DRAFT_612227 [Pelagophyceae sp. CCMP2097]